MLSGEKEVMSWNLVNDDVMQITSKAAEGFEEQNGTTNVVVAAFTTCYARLLLLKYMDEVESTRPQRILYFGRSLSFCFMTSHLWLNDVYVFSHYSRYRLHRLCQPCG